MHITQGKEVGCMISHIPPVLFSMILQSCNLRNFPQDKYQWLVYTVNGDGK